MVSATVRQLSVFLKLACIYSASKVTVTFFALAYLQCTVNVKHDLLSRLPRFGEMETFRGVANEKHG